MTVAKSTGSSSSLRLPVMMRETRADRHQPGLQSRVTLNGFQSDFKVGFVTSPERISEAQPSTKRGVRNSCESVARNSSFSRSALPLRGVLRVRARKASRSASASGAQLRRAPATALKPAVPIIVEHRVVPLAVKNGAVLPIIPVAQYAVPLGSVALLVG